jgi:thioredoxin-like negative regulator of GroEL
MAAPDNPSTARIENVDPAALDALLEREKDALVVVYMWGPDCPNCEFFAKRLPLLWPELEGDRVVLAKIDVYEYPEVARRHAVFGIPHFLLFKGGRRLGKMSEFRGDAFWLSVIRENLPQVTPPRDTA